jgi:hypothetical protein
VSRDAHEIREIYPQLQIPRRPFPSSTNNHFKGNTPISPLPLARRFCCLVSSLSISFQSFNSSRPRTGARRARRRYPYTMNEPSISWHQESKATAYQSWLSVLKSISHMIKESYSRKWQRVDESSTWNQSTMTLAIVGL